MTETMWRPSGNVAGLTDRPRLPRLGKIRLGVRAVSQKGNEYPKAVDHFVCPDPVKAVYGEKPRELDIVFPSDDIGRVAGVAWKQYTSTRGKVCTGDGEHAVRLIDIERIGANPSQEDFDRAIASADSKKVEWREIDCPAKDCAFATRNLCKPVMNLMFLLPKVPGIGVFQLDTGSYNSIVDVRGGIELVMQLSGGRLAGIPLKLRVEPMEVISPDDQKKKIVHTLKVISPATLGKVLMAGDRNLRELLMADEGSGRSVGLPELTDGRDVPRPQEPEEDLFPHTNQVIRERERLSGAQVRADQDPDSGVSGGDNGEVGHQPKATDPAPADHRPLTPTDDELEFRISQLFTELEVAPKDQQVYRTAYKAKGLGALVEFLEANRANRAKRRGAGR